MLELREASCHHGSGRRSGGRPALDGISLSLAAAGSLGIVGESGAGKTTLAQLACGLLKPSAGKVLLGGIDINAAGVSRRQQARLAQLVWQSPAGSLDPRLSIGRSLSEPLRVHGLSGRPEELLAAVGLSPFLAARRPGELSGGEAQRVVIARALATGPQLLVCDEPAASLDVRTRLKIADLLAGLRSERKLALMLITHDLELAARLTGELAIMYCGRIVESGPTAAVLAGPLHPYTRLLIESEPLLGRVPGRDFEAAADSGGGFQRSSGEEGCAFSRRCPSADDDCRHRAPELSQAGPGRMVACPPAVVRSRSGAAAV